MRTLFYSLLFSFSLLAFSFFLASQQRPLAFAHADSAQSAQSSALNGITFPVAELGNCTSRNECLSYCDQAEHVDACVAFAKAHGLLTEDGAVKAQKFAKILKSGGGPGGCTDPGSCREFCSDMANISACVSFAKQNGFNDDNLSQAEKIQQYLQSGGAMPGGCTSKDTCEQYCSDFTHVDACQAFAQKVGIVEIEDLDQQKIPSGQFQKLLGLIKEHKTPGQCANAESCQSYCQKQGHSDECLEFAKEAGFFSSDQAEKIKKLGGKGPGGCTSEDSCKTYCNDSTHQIECLQFAKEHGLISEDEGQSAQKALVRLREGVSNAPPPVQQCLSSTLGQQTLQDIEAGKLAPSPALGQQVRACFEDFKASEDPGEPLQHLPKDIAECIKQKMGNQFQQIQQGKEEATPDMADAVRACTQLKDTEDESDVPGVQQMLQHMMESAPAPVRICLQNQQQAILQETDADKLKEIVRQCLNQFHIEEMMPSVREQKGSEENQSSSFEHMQQEMKHMMIPQPSSKESEQPLPSPANASASIPTPSTQHFTVTADDNSANPSTLAVQKGEIVIITFVVSTNNVYHGGLEFHSDVVDTSAIAPGSSQTVQFTANDSFSFIPYWPSTNIQKPYTIHVEVGGA